MNLRRLHEIWPLIARFWLLTGCGGGGSKTPDARRSLVIGLAMAVSLAALAAPVTIPNAFTAGTPARAADVNANFNAVATAHNDTDARVTALEATVREPNLVPSGNLVLGPSNSSSGNVLKGTQTFIHDFGQANVFVGVSAGNLSTTAQSTAALGHGALANLTTGIGNAAVGATGDGNVGVGYLSLGTNTTGFSNVAVGASTLENARQGANNTAIGNYALAQMANGYDNLAIGSGAGGSLQNGFQNVYLAHPGLANESNTTRLGNVQTRAFIAGIRGRTPGSTNAIPVVIDEFGQLGTVVSSRRFKVNIADMGDASSLLMRLRPVTFQYRDDGNPAGPALQYGLIAEEVANVAPGLVAHSANGEVETVFYEFLPPMLLNELQKQQRSLNAQKARIAELENTIAVLAQQAHRTAALLARLERAQAVN